MKATNGSRRLVHTIACSALCLGLSLAMGPFQAGQPGGVSAESPSMETGTANVIVLLKSQPLEEAAQEVKASYRTRLESQRAQIQAAAAIPWEGRQYATVEEERDAVHSAPPLTAAQQDQLADLSSQMETLLREMRQEIITRAQPAVEASQEELVRYIESVGGTVHSRIFILNAVAATLPADQVEALHTHPDVAEVVENRVTTSHLDISTDAIDADVWWSGGYDGGVWDIGIIDSGVDDTHPALSGHSFSEMRCLNAAGDPAWDPTGDDVNGHGTHVAGITASTDGTYQGVAFGSDGIVNGKAGYDLDGSDGGPASMYWSDAMECVDWALFDTGHDDADVLNLSYGGTATSDDSPYIRFWDAVVNTGASAVAISAGNSGPSDYTVTSPSIAYNVISVAAVDDRNTVSRSDDTIANFSSRGPTPGGRRKPDIAAPGVSINSTDNSWETAGDFVAYSGTSMAAPHVAGALTLLLDSGVYDPMAQKALLINTAEDMGDPGWDTAYGWGYIDLAHAHFHRHDWFADQVQATDPDYKLYKGYANSGDTATLVWNRRAAYAGSTYPTTYYDLSDLDLLLFDEVDNSVIDSSLHADENVEQVEADATYAQVVLKVDVWGTFDGATYEDFALATEEGFSPATGPAFSLGTSNYTRDVGDEFTVEVVVNNTGDLAAHDTWVSFSLPTGLTLVSGANPQSLGTILTGDNAVGSWVVRVDADGTYNVPVSVESVSYDEYFAGSGSFRVSTAPGAGIEVAIYDHGITSDISYWTGGNLNSWSEYQAVLESDPEARFVVSIVTDLNAATLSSFDRLILPDNAVPDIYLSDVASWFTSDRRIIAIDSATCYAAYSGFMWPASAGGNGYGTYWDYNSSTDDQEVLLAHKITEDYPIGTILSSMSYDAQMFSAMLPTDAEQITAKSTDHSTIYVASRDVLGHGTIVVLGPYQTPPDTDVHELIRDAVEGPRGEPDIEVSPLSFDVTLMEGSSTTEYMDLSNVGDAPLTLAIHDEEVPCGSTLVVEDIEFTSREEGLSIAESNQADSPQSTGMNASYVYHGASTTSSILLYTDDSGGGPGMTYVDQALQALGLSYTGYFGDYDGFGAALTGSGPWDLVVVSHNAYYALGNWWSEIEAYVDGGGKVIITTFDIDGSHSESTTLWDTLGVNYDSDISLPEAVYWWDASHAIFTVPESVPQFTSLNEEHFDNGDHTDATAPTVATGGFTTSPSAHQAAIAVGSNGIVNSFLICENDADLDADGKNDAVELWENEISYMLGGDATWLWETPSSGTVGAGGSQVIDVHFDAGGLTPYADYCADIIIHSNDPDETPTLVPVVLHVIPRPDTTLRIDPVDQTVLLESGPFTVDVVVDDVDDLGGFEFTMVYSPTVVQVDDVVLGPFLASTGRSVSPVGPTIDNVNGLVTFGGFSYGSAAGPSGTGVLATITLSPVAEPESDLCLPEADAQLTDTTGATIPLDGTECGHVTVTECFGDIDGDGDVDIVDIMLVASRWGCRCGDTCYTSACDLDDDCDIDIIDILLVASRWGTVCASGSSVDIEPTDSNPTVRVDPPTSTVDQAGDEFVIAVMIDDVVNLGGFEFTMVYSPTIVHVDSVGLDDFLESTGRTALTVGPVIDNTNGSVTFGGGTYGTAPGPDGTGTLSTITFTTVYSGHSDLDLESVLVGDINGVEQELAAVEHGAVDVLAPAPPKDIFLPLVIRNLPAP